jgi:hypothetical protein
MKKSILRQAAPLVISLGLISLAAGSVRAGGTTFLPGRYSHDRRTGEQIVQHTPRPNPPKPYDPTYRRSGVNYRRSVARGDDGSLRIRSTIESWGTPWYHGYGYGYGYHPPLYRRYPHPYDHSPYPAPHAGLSPAAGGTSGSNAKKSGPVRIGR